MNETIFARVLPFLVHKEYSKLVCASKGSHDAIKAASEVNPLLHEQIASNTHGRNVVRCLNGINNGNFEILKLAYGLSKSVPKQREEQVPALCPGNVWVVLRITKMTRGGAKRALSEILVAAEKIQGPRQILLLQPETILKCPNPHKLYSHDPDKLDEWIRESHHGLGLSFVDRSTRLFLGKSGVIGNYIHNVKLNLVRNDGETKTVCLVEDSIAGWNFMSEDADSDPLVRTLFVGTQDTTQALCMKNEAGKQAFMCLAGLRCSKMMVGVEFKVKLLLRGNMSALENAIVREEDFTDDQLAILTEVDSLEFQVVSIVAKVNGVPVSFSADATEEEQLVRFPSTNQMMIALNGLMWE